jgi:hypothetical protein
MLASGHIERVHEDQRVTQSTFENCLFMFTTPPAEG